MKTLLALLLAVLMVVLVDFRSESHGVSAQQGWDPFLDTLQHRTFKWFWETTNPANGLTPDRWPTRTFSSVAAIGFALTAYTIGVERHYLERPAAADRVLTTLKFLWNAPQSDHPKQATGYKGFFYHFLDLDTGLRFEKVELSTIDTALLLAGILMCQSYFDRNNGTERDIRAYADSIYRRVDWRWAQPRPPRVALGWYPEKGFIPHDWKGYDEAMILYILALGSPTYDIEPEAWVKWTETYKWANYYGYEFISFGPLFGHQYSHCWIDFRGIQDAFMKEKGIDYFENARRATYSQREYGKENPRQYRDYSDNIWGWTACDGPGGTSFVVDGRLRRFQGYAARGVSFDWVNDDGTIAPTATGGSLPFAPQICLPTLKAMKEKYGPKLWREYGFADAFNPTYITASTSNGWFNVDYLGIDQGPIIIMAENLRSEFVWKTIKKNPYIVQGLKRAGFTGGWLSEKKSK